jgi:YbgC/YbaW family acyl-CoA thioester hydrolase
MPPFRHRMPVRFADVDHAGIVYYPRFFHYFHVAFEEFFRARLGSRSYVALLDDERVGFPAVSAHCDYKAPLRFGDTMAIDVSLERMGERSLTFRYRVYRCPDSDPGPGPGPGPALDSHPGPGSGPGDAAGTASAAEVLAAEGTSTCVVVDLDAFRPIPVPERLRQLFTSLT